MIGGAVQTREGCIRETHPLKPLLIHGDREYQQCSPKQFKGAQTQDPSLDRVFLNGLRNRSKGITAKTSGLKWMEIC